MKIFGFGSHLLVTCLIAAFFGGSVAYAQTSAPWNIVSDTPIANARFGTSVAVEADRLVVGAVYDKPNSTTAQAPGNVYVFDRDVGGTGDWQLTKKLQTAVSGTYGYGASVSLDGDRLAVGEPSAPSGSGGKVYIYEKDEGGTNQWGLVRSRSDGVTQYQSDAFGAAIKLDGNDLFVGAPGAQGLGGGGQGKVNLLVKDFGGLNNWAIKKDIYADDGFAVERFGTALDMDDDTLVVGARWTSTVVPGDYHEHGGALFVFERDYPTSGSWGKTTKLLASDIDSSYELGVSVAIDGDILVAGAIHERFGLDPGAGAVYVFEKVSGSWIETTIIHPFDRHSGQSFGYSVAIQGSNLYIGSPTHSGSSADSSGAVYIYERVAEGDWRLTDRLSGCTSSGAGSSDWYGTSISVDPNYTAIGAQAASHSGLSWAGLVEVDETGGNNCSDFENCSDVDIVLPSADNVVGRHLIATTASISNSGVYNVASPTGDVTLSAGSLVKLDSGFSVEVGATFSAIINGTCT